MKDSTLDRFRRKLLDTRRRLATEVENIRKNSLDRRDTASGDVSSMPIHMADIGSDNYDKEFALDRIEGEQEELRDIDAALEKLDEGTFGTCEACDGKVGYGRLNALPYARLCISCKRVEEKESA